MKEENKEQILQREENARNNKLVTQIHTLSTVVITIFILLQFVSGRAPALQFLLTLLLGPCVSITMIILRKKEADNPYIKHIASYGFALFFTYEMLTASESLVFILVVPMVYAVTVYGDVKYLIKINFGIFILNIIAVAGGAATGRFGYAGADKAIVQMVGVMLMAIASQYTVKTLQHNNAVKMLSRAVGIDVLTTFAEVDVADMADKGNQSNLDELEKVERTVFNEAGVSQMQFNSDSNTALNNSILNDEASMYDLLLQFESFLNLLLQPFNKSPKVCYYKAQFLNTTIYNYKEVSKLYKEQMQVGLSKMLPQVALGQTQSSILATAYFENDILDLVRVFIPPLMSSTMNAEALTGRKEVSGKETTTDSSGTGTGSPGRPEKEDNEKSEKTLQNRESI